jgi:molybdopterin converting factor small subunit
MIQDATIPVKIIFYSTLRNTTGFPETSIPVLTNSTLLDLILKIQKDYFQPKNIHLIKTDQQSLEAGLICLVNDVDISLSGGLKRKITAPITITLISSLHGG